ncbi:hypothetical protein Syun_027624 [Stephania yunnanensis]|uniref:Uncharacterized protein n=1 Tax=Stephania yunnanensis TaxID=152371 RepID=A0AAP0HL76_9MAGN
MAKSKEILGFLLRYSLSKEEEEKEVILDKLNVKETKLGNNRLVYQIAIIQNFTLELGPWLFDEHILIIISWRNETRLLSLHSHKLENWVQLHGLPITCRGEASIQEIDRYVGDFMRIDEWVKVDGILLNHFSGAGHGSSQALPDHFLARPDGSGLKCLIDMISGVYEKLMVDAKGTDVDLSTYKGKALLIVNVASQCFVDFLTYGLKLIIGFSSCCHRTVHLSCIISALAFCSAHSGMLVLDLTNQDYAIYREDNMELLYVLHGQEGGITHVQFSRDGNYLYIGSITSALVFSNFYLSANDIRNKVGIVYNYIGLLKQQTIEYSSTLSLVDDILEQAGGFKLYVTFLWCSFIDQDGQVHIYDLLTGQWTASFQAAAAITTVMLFDFYYRILSDTLLVDCSCFAHLGCFVVLGIVDNLVLSIALIEHISSIYIYRMSFMSPSQLLSLRAKLQKRRQELTRTTPDEPVDDEAVYYNVAGDCPKGCVYSLRSLWRKKRRYVDPDACTSHVLAQRGMDNFMILSTPKQLLEGVQAMEQVLWLYFQV